MVTFSLIGGETRAGRARKVAIGQQLVGADPRGNGTSLPFSTRLAEVRGASGQSASGNCLARCSAQGWQEGMREAFAGWAGLCE